MLSALRQNSECGVANVRTMADCNQLFRFCAWLGQKINFRYAVGVAPILVLKVSNATIWLRWASRHSRLDLERSRCWNVTWNLGLIWNEAWNWEKFFVQCSLSDLLSLTQISLALERKFVESDDAILLSLILNVLTLKANRLNVTWVCWAWLKSLLTLIDNLLNVRPILFLELCTICLTISGRVGPGTCFGQILKTKLPSKIT